MTTEETPVTETEVVIVEVPTPETRPGTRASLKMLWQSVGTTTKMVAAAVTASVVTAALVARNGSEEDTDETDPFAFDTSDDES